MKKLVNDPTHVVNEMIEGIVLLNPALKILKGQNVIVRSDCRDEDVLEKVALISGGGSGHEPSHAGFVGKGMLSAAVLGDVFSSPTTAQIINCIRYVAGKKGVLLIVKSYTGDMINFGIAAKMAIAEGIPVETVIVDDDVALIEKGEDVVKRGLAGTLFVHKIAGALAESGADLQEVANIARKVALSLGTLGVGLSPCIIPSVGHPHFTLPDDEIELGLGIHGEPGVQRTKIKNVDSLVTDMIDRILKSPRFHHSGDFKGKRIALIVNNLGGTTAMEIALVARRAIFLLNEKGFVIDRVYNGPLMTALDMQGVSLTLLSIENDHLVSLLDFPTIATGWPKSISQRPYKSLEETFAQEMDLLKENKIPLLQSKNVPPEVSEILKQIIQAISKTLIENSDYLTELDGKVGDGDLGENLKKASLEVLSALPNYPVSDVASTLHSLSLTLQTSLGGTSGPIYSIFCLQIAQKLTSSVKEGKDLDRKLWSESLKYGVQGIQDLGGAKLNDCTLLDALIPSIDSLCDSLVKDLPLKEAIKLASISAEKGANSTIDMIPKKGRASNLGERARGLIDPGAKAVHLIFKALEDV
eukprot:TRINITY_DN8180_c0_g1_i2.p1 TRINITY_DN8180_c0_g1~~TRINITY_DN8180_c0_g1_i2.p1  ORF type:complete len:585 (+),score=138.73 TRINITY_DN8180_c0_g1_i2:91-1845(+)